MKGISFIKYNFIILYKPCFLSNSFHGIDSTTNYPYIVLHYYTKHNL